MKKIFFAVMLGLATLMLFSSCKKDESPEPEISFQVNREGVFVYNNENDEPVVRFSITGKLSTNRDIYIPKKENFYALVQGITTSASVKSIFQGDFRFDEMSYADPGTDNFYQISPGQEVDFIYWVDVADLQDLQLYQVRLSQFFYTTRLGSEIKTKNLKNIYLEYYHQK
jgi:hypothetical protein